MPIDTPETRPAHYGGEENPFEAIKIIEFYSLNFSLGSVIKYVLRHGKKPGEDAVKDLRKAAWYANREAERIEMEREKEVRKAIEIKAPALAEWPPGHPLRASHEDSHHDTMG